MVSDEPTDGRCNAPAGPDKEGHCEQHPTTDENGDVVNGRCHYHGGKSTGAPPAKSSEAMQQNGNAITHGLHVADDKLFEHLPDHERRQVEHLVNKYVEFAGWEVDDPRVPLVVDACIDIWRRRQATAIVLKDGPSEERVVGVNDMGSPIIATEEHHLQQSISRLQGDIRMILKDLGLLNPDGAENATETAAEILSSAFVRMQDAASENDSRDVVDV